MSPRFKEFTLLSFLVVVTAVFWLSIMPQFGVPLWSSPSLVWSSLIAASLFILAWGLSIILVESTVTLIIAWAIVSFLPTLWIYNPVFLTAEALFFLFGTVAYFRGRYEMRRSYNGRLFRPLRKSVPLTLTFFIIVMATSAFIVAPAQSIDAESVIPERFFDRGLGYLSPVINKMVPGFDKDKSFEEYIVGLKALELELDPALIPDAERKQVVSNAKTKFEEDYSLIIETTDEKVSHILYGATINLIKKQVASYQAFFPVAFSVGIFLFLRLLAIPLVWVGIAIIILLNRLLIRLGVVELRLIPTEIVGYSLS